MASFGSPRLALGDRYDQDRGAGRRARLCRIARGADDVSTVCRQRSCGLDTDARGYASDQGALAAEIDAGDGV